MDLRLIHVTQLIVPPSTYILCLTSKIIPYSYALNFPKPLIHFNHKIFVDNLEHKDKRGTLKSYLSNRQKFVSCSKSSSSSLHAEHEYRRAPFCFLCIWIILLTLVTFFNFIRDTNCELHKITIFCNKLSINADKTHCVFFDRNKTFPLNIDQMYFNNQHIKREKKTLALHWMKTPMQHATED